jgi:hypothetical protein
MTNPRMAASTLSAKLATGLHSYLIALLSDPEIACLLNGEDLVAIALFLKPDARVTTASLLATLERSGYQPSGARRQLELALLEGARSNAALEPVGDVFVLARPEQVGRAAARVRPRFELAGSFSEVDNPAAPLPTPGRRRPPARRRAADAHPSVEAKQASTDTAEAARERSTVRQAGLECRRARTAHAGCFGILA